MSKWHFIVLLPNTGSSNIAGTKNIVVKFVVCSSQNVFPLYPFLSPIQTLPVCQMALGVPYSLNYIVIQQSKIKLYIISFTGNLYTLNNASCSGSRLILNQYIVFICWNIASVFKSLHFEKITPTLAAYYSKIQPISAKY